MTAFMIVALMGLMFIGRGVYVFRSEKAKPFGFWANAEMPPISDVREYNRALGKLWIVFGSFFILFGIPLIAGQNSPFAVLSILGIVIESIIALGVYTIGIEGKYRDK